MFRSMGGTSFIISSPIQTSPPVASSRPAAMRKTVVLPEPDGPTTTMNSPSAIARSSESTAFVPPGKALLSCLKSILAMACSRLSVRSDHVPVPEGAPLGDPPLRREVDEDDPEPLGVAVFPLEVVEQRPHVVAADVDSLLASALERFDVTRDVCQPALVLDHLAPVQVVVERGAVLGDQEGNAAVVALQTEEELGQRGRDDRPAHRGVLDVDVDLPEAEHRAVVGR